ncbi:DUF5518 domain-containing protein [Natrinema caseinilyticum]|uniref:DUF5518 domain-containing protein n=1 Tax=Natrinema caseinilyticum TaxID=2961570 RepID=UPI0020C1CBDF|nr:DUF5518 domain-containing protein [Natrinema caseinilyticum]
MVRSRTVINAFIGAVVSVVLSFIPLAPVLGGVVAGFLEGPDERQGTKVGALAGAISFLPIAVGGFVVLGFLGFGLGFVGGAPAAGILFLLILLFSMILFFLLYTVGLSALGGYLGAYLADDYPEKRRRTRETIGFESTSDGSVRAADTAPIRDRHSGHIGDVDSDVGQDVESEPGRDSESEPGRDSDSDRDRTR